MKKYLGLIIFLGLAIALIPSVANGEEVLGGVEANTEVNAPLTTEQKRIQAEARLRALEEEAEIRKIEERVKREILESDIRARLQTEPAARTVETVVSPVANTTMVEMKAADVAITLTREEVLNKVAELKASVKEEADEEKAKMAEERIIGREKALERFDKAIEKVESKKETLEAFIKRFEAKNVNTEKAVSLANESGVEITVAKEKTLEAYMLLFASAEELTEEAKEELQAISKDIQEAIKVSHAKLNDAARALKDAVSKRQAAAAE